MNSRAKGAAGERELANILKEYGYDARRGQQFSGANGDADVVGLPYIHIECKRVEALNLSKAMDQSRRDTIAAMKKEERLLFPTVFHRKNKEGWMVTMDLDTFQILYDAFLKDREGKGVSR